MIQITKRESMLIQNHFPKAEIISTKHRSYLIGKETDDVGRFLLSRRGEPQPPTRREKERERLGDRFGHMFSDRQTRCRP